MTVKQAYENVLRELRKVKAPSLHLEDYLYFGNKGIQEYVNLSYNIFQTSQQITDDIQPLIKNAYGTIINNVLTFRDGGGAVLSTSTIVSGKRYNSDFIKFNLFPNYLHWLGAHAEIINRKPTKCSIAGSTHTAPVKLLTNDVANQIMTNQYAKPSAEFGRVYYNLSDGLLNSILPSVDLFYGDKPVYNLKTINIDYLQKPANITMTDNQANFPIDQTTSLEFPEYACAEIVKIIVKLILENTSDPRLQTHIPINSSIPRSPGQSK